MISAKHFKLRTSHSSSGKLPCSYMYTIAVSPQVHIQTDLIVFECASVCLTAACSLTLELCIYILNMKSATYRMAAGIEQEVHVGGACNSIN